jgi:malic enzyme
MPNKSQELLAELRNPSSKPIERHILLRKAQVEDPESFWNVILSNTNEMLPYVYTPTVGEACQVRINTLKLEFVTAARLAG